MCRIYLSRHRGPHSHHLYYIMSLYLDALTILRPVLIVVLGLRRQRDYLVQPKACHLQQEYDAVM